MLLHCSATAIKRAVLPQLHCVSYQNRLRCPSCSAAAIKIGSIHRFLRQGMGYYSLRGRGKCGKRAGRGGHAVAHSAAFIV